MKIQTNPEILQRQQMVLKHLGYYSGILDGIWGPASIKAKRDFEMGGSFVPGIPNRGLPFVVGTPLPLNVFPDPTKPGYLTCEGLTPEIIADMLKEKSQHTGEKISEEVELQDVQEVKEETVQQPTPKPVQQKPKHQSQRHRNRN